MELTFNDPVTFRKFKWEDPHPMNPITVEDYDSMYVNFPVSDEVWNRISLKTKTALFFAYVEFWKERYSAGLLRTQRKGIH